MRYALGMRIVAECLETGEQFELIKEYAKNMIWVLRSGLSKKS